MCVLCACIGISECIFNSAFGVCSKYLCVVGCFELPLYFQPLKIIHDIEDRLNGKFPQKTKGLPLSVEGQVDALIKVDTFAVNKII